MSWSLNVKGAPDEIAELIDGAAANPTQRSNRGKAQVAAAKEAATALVEVLEPAEGNLVAVTASGHANDVEGMSPYGSLSVSVHEAPSETSATPTI